MDFFMPKLCSCPCPALFWSWHLRAAEAIAKLGSEMENFFCREPWMPVLRMPDAPFLQTQQLLLPPKGSGSKGNPGDHFLFLLSLAQLIPPSPTLQNGTVGKRRRERASSQGLCFRAWSPCGGTGRVGWILFRPRRGMGLGWSWT